MGDLHVQNLAFIWLEWGTMTESENLPEAHRHQPAPAAGTSAEPAHTDSASDKGPWALTGLVVVAVISSIVMLVTDNAAAMKIAVIASLWAALLGVFLVTAYRRRLEASQQRLNYEREIFAVELEKELSEHREQEMLLEQRYTDQLEDQRDEVLETIREHLGVVRAQLEELMGQDLSYEPAALQAQARRMDELEQRMERAISSATAAAIEQAASHAPQPQSAPRATARPLHTAAATPAQPAAPAQPEAHGHHEKPAAQASPQRPDPAPADKKPRSSFDTSSFAAVDWTTGTRRKQQADPAPQPQAKPAPQVTPAPQPGTGHTGGRRRRDEHSNALSVADLLKRNS